MQYLKQNPPKVKLHVSDCTRLSVREYQDLIYGEIGAKWKGGSISGQREGAKERSKSKMVRTEESRPLKVAGK